jgi:TRAP-type C4-dicarboxylate transport system permease small subunit
LGALPISFSWTVLSLPLASISMAISACIKLRDRTLAIRQIRQRSVL